MCGNGIRCVAKYVYDKGLTDARHISIASGGRVRYLDLQVEEDPTSFSPPQKVPFPTVSIPTALPDIPHRNTCPEARSAQCPTRRARPGGRTGPISFFPPVRLILRWKCTMLTVPGRKCAETVSAIFLPVPLYEQLSPKNPYCKRIFCKSV